MTVTIIPYIGLQKLKFIENIGLQLGCGCKNILGECSTRVAIFKSLNIIRPKRSERESPKIPSIYIETIDLKHSVAYQPYIFPKNHNFPET